MIEADLGVCAALHARELRDGFLAQLGPGFIRRYLATFLGTEGAVALVAEAGDGQPAGFVVGSTRHGHNRAALRDHAGPLLRAAVVGLCRHPQLVVPFMRTRAKRYARTALRQRRRGAAPASPELSPSRAPAVLLHVVVAPAHRGKGAGAILVGSFVEAAKTAGAQRAALVTFSDSGFYSRLGWQRLAERRDADGQLVVTYGLEL